MWSRRSPSGCGDAIWPTVNCRVQPSRRGGVFGGVALPVCNAHSTIHYIKNHLIMFPGPKHTFVICAWLISQQLQKLDTRRPFCLCKLDALNSKFRLETGLVGFSTSKLRQEKVCFPTFTKKNPFDPLCRAFFMKCH